MSTICIAGLVRMRMKIWVGKAVNETFWRWQRFLLVAGAVVALQVLAHVSHLFPLIVLVHYYTLFLVLIFLV